MSSIDTRCFFCNRYTEDKLPNNTRDVWQEQCTDGIIHFLPYNATMGMMHITVGRWLKYNDRDALWCRKCTLPDCGVQNTK